MPKASPIQVSFNAGELSPQLKGRIDLDKYRNGCETMLNFIPQIHGPAKKRPGTRFVREVKTSAKKTRLIPFQFNVFQSYILEFGDLYIRFHRDGGTVLDAGVPYEIVSTYLEAELPAIHFAQSADVMYLVHQNHPPRKLSRLGDANWTIADVTFTSGPFGAGNYPKAVSFFEDRLWFAGTLANPSTLWASVTGDYENFTMGTVDDDALSYTINSQEVDIIEWISPGKVLSIGTTGSEFTATGGGIDAAITPTNVRIVPQTTYGSRDMQPFKIAGSIIFTQRAGRKVRELTYNFESDSYVAPNLTILAEHITKAGVVDITYEQEPYQIIWFADANGQLLGMTYERAEDVIGWHRHDVSGEVESLATVPHWDRDQDVTFMIVKRTINGSVVRYIEYIEKYLTGEHAFFVNSGLTYDDVPITTITGIDHLEGEEVVVLVDGAIHPNRTVTGGEIELQYEGSVVTVGLPYTATIKTMPIEAGAADGVAQGKTMRINNLTIRLDNTGPGLFYGNDTRMDEYHPRTTTMDMDEAIPVFTGDTDLLPWPGGYEKGSQITIDHRLPTPCTLVALMPQLHTYDR